MNRLSLLLPLFFAVALVAIISLPLSTPIATAQIATVTATVEGAVPQPPPPPNPQTTEEPGAAATPLPPDPATEATPAPAVPPVVEVAPVTGSAPAVLDAAIADTTLLADLVYGVGSRPEGWTPFLTPDNPQAPLLLRLNVEILAGQILGGVLPPDWFGAVASTPFAIARDIRHDLELLAEAVAINAGNPAQTRPDGWRGDDPIMRCGRAVQALVGVLEAGGVFRLQADPTSPDFCAQAELAASQFAEGNLLNTGGGASAAAAPGAAPAGVAVVNTTFAVAFLDRGASLRVGVIPNGTSITPVGRSFAQFSNMMLVRGENFEVFVDYTATSVTEAEFELLPDVTGIENAPFCGADWCAGG